MTLKGQYSRELYAKIREALTNYGGTGGRPATVAALWLGGVGGEDGGEGGPPGMFIGQLPQSKVCHDTTEAETDAGSASLVDNLNAMRLMAKRYAFMLSSDEGLSSDGGGGGGVSTWLALTDTPSVFTGKGGFYPQVNDEETALELVELAGSETTKFVVQAVGGYNNTIADVLVHRYEKGLLFSDDHDCDGHGQFTVPENFLSGMSIKAVIWPGTLANGNVYTTNTAEYGQCAESHAEHSDSDGPTAIAVTATDRNCIQEVTLTNVAAGDLVSLTFRREADDALDTANDDAWFYGWLIEYTASAVGGAGAGAGVDIVEVWVKY